MDTRELLLYANYTSWEVIKVKKQMYDECWREFVKVHEQYIELLVCEKERESACRSYKEQRAGKVNVDEMVASLKKKLRTEARERGEELCSSSGKTSSSLASKSTSHSSKSSTLSRKKEKLALARLKRSQLSKQHELKRKMVELKLGEEAMEAEIEEERALVSVNVYNDRRSRC